MTRAIHFNDNGKAICRQDLELISKPLDLTSVPGQVTCGRCIRVMKARGLR